MKSNTLAIQINRSIEDIFSYLLNPQNTPEWIESIILEEVNKSLVDVGTVFRNLSKEGEWSTYIVTELKENQSFTLASKDGNYHVQYTFESIDHNKTYIKYYEWVDMGDLDEPFTLQILQKLKSILEH